jgi:hypothetical protein
VSQAALQLSVAYHLQQAATQTLCPAETGGGETRGEGLQRTDTLSTADVLWALQLFSGAVTVVDRSKSFLRIEEATSPERFVG